MHVHNLTNPNPNPNEVREGLRAGTALVGTVDSWLVWNLTNPNFNTDPDPDPDLTPTLALALTLTRCGT